MKAIICLFCFCLVTFFSYSQESKSASLQTNPDTQHDIYHNNTPKAQEEIDKSLNNNKLNDVDSLVGEIQGSEKKVLDSLQAVQSKITDSINSINKKAGGILDKVEPNTSAVDTPSLPELPNSDLSQDLPIDAGHLNEKIDIPELNTGDLQSEIPDNQIDVPDVKSEVDGLSENPDQFIDKKASQMDAMNEFNQQQSMAGDPMKNLPGEKPSLGNMTDPEKLASLDNQQAMEKMNELFDVHSDKLQATQGQMAKLKKKYSSVPNSHDLSTATKINSLKDEPLKKRLIVGTNFKFEGGNPIALDFSPLIMYKFNKAFHAGISGNYRASINYDEKSLSTNPQDVIGGSVLARHFVISSFFAYTEFEYKGSTYSYDGKNWNSLADRQWVKGWLAGIGKEMTLYKKLKGTIILTYDFLHSEQSFNNSPWNIKLGFHLDDLDLKGKGDKNPLD